jgi:flagellar operon protein
MAPTPARPSASSFHAELEHASRPVQISRHAQRRLETRSIDLGPDELSRLSNAVDALTRKGANHSVVMLDRLALVVNVPSATVVTAVQPHGGREAVFTRIDSVVIA